MRRKLTFGCGDSARSGYSRLAALGTVLLLSGTESVQGQHPLASGSIQIGWLMLDLAADDHELPAEQAPCQRKREV